jgi:hypothetical protein
MGLINFVEVFESILAPDKSDGFQFSASSISDNTDHRIAKDKLNNPSLLLAINATEVVIPSVKLKNISIAFNIRCKVKQNGVLHEKLFTVINFTGSDKALKNHFLRLCAIFIDSFKMNSTAEDIRRHINSFIELFRLASIPPLKTVQGLWSELFLISQASMPHKLIQSWHFLPEEKFDFNNGQERIEVKSSVSPSRIHSFAIEQLNPPEDTIAIVASVITSQTSNGLSIDNLRYNIEKKLDGHMDLIGKLRHQIAKCLGNCYDEAIKVRFDVHLAKSSIRFYETKNIPKISSDSLSPLVTDVHFKSDLSMCESLNTQTFKDVRSFFSELSGI